MRGIGGHKGICRDGGGRGWRSKDLEIGQVVTRVKLQDVRL